MERLNIPAAGILRNDLLLTAKADDTAIVYADLVYSVDDDDSDVLYVLCETTSFRFVPDQIVTVLRGINL